MLFSLLFIFFLPLALKKKGKALSFSSVLLSILPFSKTFSFLTVKTPPPVLTGSSLEDSGRSFLLFPEEFIHFPILLGKNNPNINLNLIMNLKATRAWDGKEWKGVE